MKLTTCSALLAATLVFTGCDALPSAGSLNPMGSASGGDQALETAKMMAGTNMYTLYSGMTDVGTWWETTANGQPTKVAIVHERDGMLVIEETVGEGDNAIVTARLVDPSVDMTRVVAEGELMAHNVVKAWVGHPGDKPVEVDVMEPMKMPAMPKVDPVDVPKSVQGDESVTMGGKTWNAQWTETDGSKVWADKSTGLMLRTDMGGSTYSELTGFGTDAKPSLDWVPAK